MNLDKLFALITQPERSGIVGAILAVLFLLSIVASGAGGDDPFCGILPWKCTVHAAEQDTRPNKRRDLHVQFIAPGNGHGKGRVCMEDYTAHYKGYTYHSIDPSVFLEDCDQPDYVFAEIDPWRQRYEGRLKYYWSDKIVHLTERIFDR